MLQCSVQSQIFTAYLKSKELRGDLMTVGQVKAMPDLSITRSPYYGATEAGHPGVMNVPVAIMGIGSGRTFR